MTASITLAQSYAAFEAAAKAAKEMLKVGNVFEGAFQIADRLFARENPLWGFAVAGARVEIEHFPGGIYTDKEGRIVYDPGNRRNRRNRICDRQ